MTRVVPVPAELTAPIAEPEFQGETNGALLSYIDRLREWGRLLNKRLESIGNIKP